MPVETAEAREWARRLLYYATRSRYHRCALDRDEAEDRLEKLAGSLDNSLGYDARVTHHVALQTDEGHDLLWAIAEGLREHRRLGDYESMSPEERDMYYQGLSGAARLDAAKQAVMDGLAEKAKQYWFRNADPSLFIQPLSIDEARRKAARTVALAPGPVTTGPGYEDRDLRDPFEALFDSVRRSRVSFDLLSSSISEIGRP